MKRSCAPIKGEGLPKGSRLLEVYATSPDGARRNVHLLAVADDTLFLLFYRGKTSGDCKGGGKGGWNLRQGTTQLPML